MVQLDDDTVATWAINIAREYGEYRDRLDQVGVGEYGQFDVDFDWELTDLEPTECRVEYDDGLLTVTGVVTGHYTVQTLRARYNPPDKAHPAEYENRDLPVIVSIEIQFPDLPAPVIDAQLG